MTLAAPRAAFALAAAAAAHGQGWPPQRQVPASPADTLYYNARIITMWPDRPVAESMTVADGRVLAVGTTQQVGRTTGPRTRQVNLRGQTVVPGLIDSHVHPISAALTEAEAPIPELDSFESLRRFVQGAGGAGLVFVPKVYSTRLRERRYPTRWEVDEYSGDRPVLLDNGYAAVLNSAALRMAGISGSTPDPPNGKLARAASGEPTGLIVGARQLVAPLLRSNAPSLAEMVEALARMQRAYSSVGLTSVGDRGQGPRGFRAYQQLWRAGRMQVRTTVTRRVDAERPLQEVLEEIRGVAAITGHGDDMLRVGPLKVSLDGGILLGTAYLRAPYGANTAVYGFSDPAYRGELRIPRESLEEILRTASSLGWQVTAHTTGGGSTDILLDAYGALHGERPIAGRRFALTHANFLHGDAIARAASMGVVADMQPAWYHYDGPALAKVLGAERMGTLQPYRSLLDAGIVVAGGSDHMAKLDPRGAVNPYAPFFGMWAASTRIASDGSVHNPEQRVSRSEALRMWTWNAAYLTFDEDIKGSLEPGKLADFVIVDRDILTCTDREFRDTAVLATFLGGREVYRASP